MVLLIDANVILDYLLVRQPQYNDVVRLIYYCEKYDIKEYAAFHTISIIWYHLRKIPIANRRNLLLNVTNLFIVTGASHESVVNAIKNENFPDFEDCLQEKCALAVNADYIVTNNVKDFKSSEVPAVTPEKMLEIILKIEEE